MCIVTDSGTQSETHNIRNVLSFCPKWFPGKIKDPEEIGVGAPLRTLQPVDRPTFGYSNIFPAFLVGRPSPYHTYTCFVC